MAKRYVKTGKTDRFTGHEFYEEEEDRTITTTTTVERKEQQVVELQGKIDELTAEIGAMRRLAVVRP